MTATEKISEIMGMIGYIEALSLLYKDRVELSSIPPQNGHERFTRVSIGFGQSAVTVTSHGDSCMMTWNDNGVVRRERIDDLQKAIGEGAKHD